MYEESCSAAGLKVNAAVVHILQECSTTDVADFSSLYLGPKQCNAAASALLHHKGRLRLVSFRGCGLRSNDDSTAILWAMLNRSLIEALDVSDNSELDDASACGLLALLQSNPYLTAVNVSGTSISDRFVEDIAVHVELNMYKKEEMLQSAMLESAGKSILKTASLPSCLEHYNYETMSNSDDVEDLSSDLERYIFSDVVSIDDLSSTQKPTKKTTNIASCESTTINDIPTFINSKQLLKEMFTSGKLDVKFTDKEFPPTNESLTGSPGVAVQRGVVWRRFSEMFPESELSMCGTSPVIRGTLGGTQFFINALTCVATSRQSMCLKTYTDMGLHVFQLHKAGVAVEVVVDDFVPVDAATGSFLFCRNSQLTDMWASLLEKAYAKLHGSYQRIRGGSMKDAVEDLTNGICVKTKWNLKAITRHTRHLWEVIRARLHAGHNVVAKCGAHEKLQRLSLEATGLVPNGAYVVTSTKSVGIYDLVSLQSPASVAAWKGRFGIPSPEVLQYSKDLGHLSTTQYLGRDFWMVVEDFAAFFDTLYEVVFPVGSPLYNSARFEALRGAFDASSTTSCMALQLAPSYLLQAKKNDTVVYLQLRQADPRIHRQQVSTEPTNRMQLLAFRSAPGGTKRYDLTLDGALAATPLVASRTVTLRVPLHSSPVQIVVLSDSFLRFEVVAVSESRFEFLELPSTALVSSYHGEWSGLTAGGRPQLKSFTSNPVLCITSSSSIGLSQDVVILLCQTAQGMKGLHLMSLGLLTTTSALVDSHSVETVRGAPPEPKLLTDFARQATVVANLQIRPNTKYKVVPMTWDADSFGSFDIVICSQQPVQARFL